MELADAHAHTIIRTYASLLARGVFSIFVYNHRSLVIRKTRFAKSSDFLNQRTNNLDHAGETAANPDLSKV